jgi:hypothetical protein
MKTLGQVAYEAYGKHSFGVALVTGIIIPKWDELSDRVKQVWQIAAQAAVESFIEVKNKE